MRHSGGIPNDNCPNDRMFEGTTDNEKINGAVAASGGVWGNDDAADQVEPPGFGELLWSAVPISTDDPRTAYEGKTSSYASEKVGIVFVANAN